MGQKDMGQKILEAYDDVFADIVNALLFEGKEVIKPDELEDAIPRSIYKAEGEMREMERDVCKRWNRQNIRLACIGLENQTEQDKDMPLRVFAYDGAEYRAQLDGDARYPVVTLVLYFGTERWTAPKSLCERLDIPEPFRPYVNDYKINVYEVAHLTDEQLARFRSDFSAVADYMVKSRRDKDYAGSALPLVHGQETMTLMRVMTGDYRFEECLNLADLKGGQLTMCEFLDRVEERGVERGMERGMERGLAQGKQYGEDILADLMTRLFTVGRNEDAVRAAADREYRKKLFQEFGIH